MDGGVVGAALGQGVSELCKIVKDATRKTQMFKPLLQRLESKLERLKPVVEEIESLNMDLGRQEETKALIEQMKKAEDHVSQYSNLPPWKSFMRSRYANKLCELEEALSRFFEFYVQAWNLRNGSRVWLRVKDIHDQLMNNSVGSNNGVGSCAVPEPPDFTVGLDVPLKELKMQLFKEEVSKLLLTAPGGCGKTTLVKMLCRDEEIQDKYDEDNIFFVTVSKTPNTKVIVREIFRHKKEPVPEFRSDEHAINQLVHLLKRINHKPILLILDDVWSGSLVDNFELQMPNYKILMTSRTAFSTFSFRYNLKPLNDEDAEKLFCHHSKTLQDGSSDIPDREIVKKIVKGCGGFPLALKVVGRSLCRQPEAVWESRVMKWFNGHSMLNSHSDLLLCLQSSLDFNGDEIILKDCFMDLGSFPEDQRIPVAALIDMWLELYDEIDKCIHAINNLHEIADRNLANLVVTRKDASEDWSYYTEDFVLQHDLLRELAIHESSQEPIEQRKRLIMDVSGNNLPKWWTEQRQQLINAQLLSISTDEMFSSSWCNIQAPEVEALVLNFQTKNYALPEFVEKMNKLKVLIVRNYGFFQAGLDNFQLIASVPYLKRIRLEKVSIPSIFKTPVQLRSLEKISLYMCYIGQAFRNCTVQVSDAFPNLMEIDIDYCNDLKEFPAELCDILQLKKLSITNCHKLSTLPKEIEKLVNLEVLRLRSCIDFVQLPESITSLHMLRLLDISDCPDILKLPKNIGKLCSLKKLYMKECLRFRGPLPESIKDLKQLKLVICDKRWVEEWEFIKESLTGLKIKVAEKDINLNWLYNHY